MGPLSYEKLESPKIKKPAPFWWLSFIYTQEINIADQREIFARHPPCKWGYQNNAKDAKLRAPQGIWRTPCLVQKVRKKERDTGEKPELGAPLGPGPGSGSPS